MSRLQMISIFIVFTMMLGLSSCSEGDDEINYVAGFEFEIDSSDPNTVNFTNTSSGDYLYVQWDFGNGETTGKETDKTSTRSAYYPFAGTYQVTLTVWGELNSITDTKNYSQEIIIEADDPDVDVSEQIIWSDEFNNSTINTSNWKFETGDWGWGNNELQMYTNGSNAHIENGNLIITARKVNDEKTAGSYTSTRMITLGKQEFTYGRIEVRAKLPTGTGVWPAIWMLGANIESVSWPACGEIDIMEYVGFQPDKIHGSIHTPSSYGATVNTGELGVENCEEDFNIYGINWTKESISFYVNDRENPYYTYSPAVKNSDTWPFDKPHFFILNIAVGGTWGGMQGINNSIFPQTMQVDYVRVYSN